MQNDITDISNSYYWHVYTDFYAQSVILAKMELPYVMEHDLHGSLVSHCNQSSKQKSQATCKVTVYRVTRWPIIGHRHCIADFNHLTIAEYLLAANYIAERTLAEN